MKIRTYWTLVKLSSAYRTQTKPRSQTGRVLGRVVSLIAMLPFEAILFSMYNNLYALLKSVHAEAAVIAISVVVAQMLAFLFGLMFVATTLYFARDIETFLVYPLSPWVLVSARFAWLWWTELVTTALFAGPGFVAYGLHEGSLSLRLQLVLMLVLVPVIPLMLAFIFMSIFMRVTNVRGLRNTLRYLGGILGIAVYVGIQVVLRDGVGQAWSNAAAAQQFLTGPNGYVTKISAVFPPSLWEINALTAPAATQRLLFWGLTLLLTAALTGLCVLLAERLFLSGYLGTFEQARRRRKATDLRTSRRKRSTGPVRALLIREWKVFLRTPAFVMNTMSSMVTGFFAAVLPILSGNWDYLSSMDPWVAALATAGFLVFMGTGSMVALTTTTREGKQFYHLKVLPISAHTYVRAKWWSANVYCLAIALVANIVQVAVLHMSPSAALMGTVMGLVACAAYNAFAVFLDLSEPNLNWANEQMAFQGKRIYLLLIGELLVGGVVAGIDALIHFSLHLDWLAVYGIDLVVAGAALVLALSSLNENASALYAEIE
jgi:ABC-2 type transport system permease protein